MASVPLDLAHHPTHVVLNLGCTRSVGSRKAIRRFQKHALYFGSTTDIFPCNMSFVFAKSETETGRESCIIHLPTKPLCSIRVDVLETGDVPILFSLPQMKNFGTTVELDPKGDNITYPALVCADRTAVSEYEDDKSLVQPASREKLVKRESAAEKRVFAQLRRRKGPPIWRDQSATLEQDV